jgi:hypothetical protein
MPARGADALRPFKPKVASSNLVARWFSGHRANFGGQMFSAIQ